MSTYIDPNTEAWIEQLQARIAELERKPIQCHRCGDPITNELGDNPICGACALASELNVKTLQARIAEVEAENAIFRNADYDALQCGSRIAELEKYRIEGVSLKTIEAVNESFRKKVAQLEAENAKLKEALEKAARTLDEDNCCPDTLAAADCDGIIDDDRANCRKCWLDWLMNNNQNKGDTNE